MSNRKPAAPAHLSGESKRHWSRILSEFKIEDAAGLLLLRCALEAWDRAQDARARIAKHGPIIKDRYGSAKAHPLLSIEKDARSSFLACMRTLALDVGFVSEVATRKGSR